MPQIIAENRKPTTGERFSKAFGNGLQIYEAMQREQEQKLGEVKEAAALKKFGIDVEGMGPEMRQKVVPELLKLEGKKSLQQEDFNYFSKLMGGNKQQSNPQSLVKSDLTQEETQEQNGLNLRDIPDEKIAEITIRNPKVGKAIGDAKEAILKADERDKSAFQKERDYNSKYADPVINQANTILEGAPSRKGLVRQWKQDIESGNTSGFGQFMVDKSGLEFWRSPESARSLAAGKNYFIDTLDSLAPGTRLNQFLEKNLYAALPQIGRDIESQLSVLDMQDFLDDLKEEKAKIVTRLATEDEEKYGYAKKDINTRAQKELEPYAEERQKKLALDVRKTHEDRRSNEELANELVLGKIPSGAPLTPRMMSILMIKNNDNVDKAIREATKLGFELPRRKQ